MNTLTPYNQQEFNQLCAQFCRMKFSQTYLKYDDFDHYWGTENDGIWYKEKDFVHSPDSNKMYYVHVNNIPLKDFHYSLKFHSDWNWIMDVLKEIQKRKHQDWMGTYITIGMPKEGCVIEVKRESSDFYCSIDSNTDDTKKATIQAVWEFLNWYKEQSYTN